MERRRYRNDHGQRQLMLSGGTGQNLPLADTFNIHQALIDLGNGSDSITTGWNHLGNDPTTYRGGSGSDTIRVVFTGTDPVE